MRVFRVQNDRERRGRVDRVTGLVLVVHGRNVDRGLGEDGVGAVGLVPHAAAVGAAVAEPRGGVEPSREGEGEAPAGRAPGSASSKRSVWSV